MTETNRRSMPVPLHAERGAQSDGGGLPAPLCGDHFEVLKCGPHADRGPSYRPRQILTEAGLDPRGLRAKGLPNDVLGKVRIHYEVSG